MSVLIMKRLNSGDGIDRNQMAWMTPLCVHREIIGGRRGLWSEAGAQFALPRDQALA
jgi:hypothetical protein